MSKYFITSSGTGVGKTLFTAALCHQLRQKGEAVEALKPVISGFEEGSDTHLLLDALEKEPTAEAIEQMSPWRFKAALSPDMAAVREKREVDFSALVGFCQDRIKEASGTILIEGVGGVMVPLNQKETVLDWILALNLPAILVVGSYLGSMSHTITAAHVLKSAGVFLKAVVISESQDSPVSVEETAKTLSRFLPDVQQIILPRLPECEKLWEKVPELSFAD
ncbi:MAG: dethiobiotin synthase [Rhodospirillales bacterium]|nr:dethiobiotin synthase [Rhodospirillales bacterium]